MAVRSVSFDDDGDSSDLFVFSGYDLMLAHYDVADLGCGEIAERSRIDERRGLVIAQVAMLEDIIDEFIHYVEDPVDPEQLQKSLDRSMLGQRLQRFESGHDIGMLDAVAKGLIRDLRSVVNRRNQLAHGKLYCQVVGFPIPAAELIAENLEVEWLLIDRRRQTSERISMLGLGRDLEEAAGMFSATPSFAAYFVERAPSPVNFRGGSYLGVPTP